MANSPVFHAIDVVNIKQRHVIKQQILPDLFTSLILPLCSFNTAQKLNIWNYFYLSAVRCLAMLLHHRSRESTMLSRYLERGWSMRSQCCQKSSCFTVFKVRVMGTYWSQFKILNTVFNYFSTELNHNNNIFTVSFSFGLFKTLWRGSVGT